MQSAAARVCGCFCVNNRWNKSSLGAVVARHVRVWHGRGILSVRREDAPCSAPCRQEIPIAGPEAAWRPHDDRNVAVAAGGRNAALRDLRRGTGLSRALPARAGRDGGPTLAGYRGYGHFSSRLLAGPDRNAKAAIWRHHRPPADDRLTQHAL